MVDEILRGWWWFSADRRRSRSVVWPFFDHISLRLAHFSESAVSMSHRLPFLGLLLKKFPLIEQIQTQFLIIDHPRNLLKLHRSDLH